MSVDIQVKKEINYVCIKTEIKLDFWLLLLKNEDKNNTYFLLNKECIFNYIHLFYIRKFCMFI